MRVIGTAILLAGLAASPVGAAQPAPPVSPRVVVIGSATVETPPDVATISYNVRGEGATAAAALAAFAIKRTAIEAAVVAVGQPKVMLHSGEIAVAEARAKACKDDGDEVVSLSTGDCQVRGYVVVLSSTVTVKPITTAATIVAAAARNGASNPKISGFELAEPAAAQRRAMVAAIADARAQAMAIADATGGHLGAIVAVEDDQAQFGRSSADVVVTALRNAAPSPALLVDPIEISPEPKSTTAKVIVTYALQP